MRRFTTLYLVSLIAAALVASADPVMGNWEGSILNGSLKDATLTAEVIGMSQTTYRLDLHISSAGQSLADAQINGLRDGNTAVFVGSVDLGEKMGGQQRVIATAADNTMKGTLTPINAAADTPTEFAMERVFKKPPTLGLAAPENAAVLMDGTTMDAWNLSPGNLIDGALQVGSSNFISKQEFGDQKIHLEFRTPYMPNDRDQGRGNSGVYVQGRYEIQVLDSYGDPPADNRCGGIYSISPPAVEADLPPGEWQTYDIEFQAPKFNAKGKKTKDARITVRHNGLLIHDDVVLDHTTPGGVSREEAPKGPLMLQDHHNPVQYRNVWIAPLD